MRTSPSTSRSTDFSSRAVSVLTVVAGVLLAALVYAPTMLAARGRDSDLADGHNLVHDSRGAFLGYWNAGKEEYPPNLQRVVDYLVHYNVAKAVIASLLLIVLTGLASFVWKAFLTNGSGRVRGAALMSTGVVAVALALLTLWTTIASIQRAAAPFAALLASAVGPASHNGPLADAIDQIKQQLALPAGGNDQARSALDGIVHDYVRFHVVHVIAAAPIALVFLCASVMLWTRTKKGSVDRRTRRVLTSFAVSSVLLSFFFIFVLAVNVSTIANPVPGLLAFFDGSR